MMTARPVYVVHLRPAPGIDGARALRALLKATGRAFGLRCVAVREQPLAPSRFRVLAGAKTHPARRPGHDDAP